MPAKQPPTSSYPVGYKKPPQHRRFKKGQSGNPAGRPKGSPNFATALERALNEQVVVTEGGQRHTVSKLEAAVKQLVNKATLGDPRATQQLLSVLSVIDPEPSESSPSGQTLTEADQQVIDGLIERIRATTPGGAPHADPQPA